jgi:predicted glutamine amidotransferase
MCRMIAAVGRFEMKPALRALKQMALNRNPAYDHELRDKGDALQHDCGWGVAYRKGGELTRVRSAVPCFEDDAFDSLAGVETELMILHARRTVARNTIRVENSHPFLAEHDGESWAFCHNGEVRDLSQIPYDSQFVPEGDIDSEPLFFHILSRLDRDRPTESLGEILSAIRDFTAANCFLARRDSVLAGARMDPETPRPRYYRLWQGRGEGFTLVSSEVVAGFDAEWEAVPDRSAVLLAL